jgi:CDP-glucose 4,6-dehydratase
MGGHDPYSSSKGCAELVTTAYRRSFFGAHGKARVASARAGNVIGGGDWAEDRLVPDMVRAFQASEPVRIRNPHAVRPWQHVLEPLAGYMTLAERLADDDGEQYAEAWNFGPGEDDARPVQYIVEALSREWGDSARWEADHATQPHEASFLRLDCSLARSRLGWRPRMKLDMALNWTVSWYRDVLSRGADARRLTENQINGYQQLPV